MIQIPKFIKDVTRYFQYEESPNPTTQDDLQAFLKNQHATLNCLVDGLWQPETMYKEGQIVRSPNMEAGYNAKVTKAGTSGTNEPDWGGATATDGTVEWKIQKQGAGGGGASWESETFYGKGSTVSIEGNTSFFLLCIVEGTSGEVQPVVSDDSTIVDGSVTWLPVYYAKLPVLDKNNYIKGENLSGYWKAGEMVEVDTVRYLQGDIYAGYYIKCTYAGTTGETQPTPNIDSTEDFSDNTAKWSLKEIADSSILEYVAEVITYPKWYLDRGDGSDGAFNPSSGTAISGIKNYSSVNIPSGVTVTIERGTRIKCKGVFVNNGTITANGKGASGGAGGSLSNGYAGGNGTLSRGGAGGNYGDEAYGGGGGSIEGSYLKDTYDADLYGAGGGSGAGGENRFLKEKHYGGAGGAGGGDIVIAAKEFNNTGTISANGTNGSKGYNDRGRGTGAPGGGGGGGRVMIVAAKLYGSGKITANAGVGGTSTAASGEEGYIFTKEIGV